MMDPFGGPLAKRRSVTMPRWPVLGTGPEKRVAWVTSLWAAATCRCRRRPAASATQEDWLSGKRAGDPFAGAFWSKMSTS